MQAKGAPHLIAAAVLHDVGHLLHGLSEDIAAHDIDGRHEVVGEAWLRSRFGSIVSEPVRLHVDAKRYLCFKEPAYQAELSASSLLSLKFRLVRGICGSGFEESMQFAAGRVEGALLIV
jgi:[1-hydroxy-2-(trimethylamino)ethyl]phosphonate dioxygenase